MTAALAGCFGKAARAVANGAEWKVIRSLLRNEQWLISQAANNGRWTEEVVFSFRTTMALTMQILLEGRGRRD